MGFAQRRCKAAAAAAGAFGLGGIIGPRWFGSVACVDR